MALLLVAPAVLVVATFFYVPMLQSFYWSFTKFNGNSAPVWVGLRNYRQLLAGSEFPDALRQSVAFTLMSMTAGPALGLASALLLNRVTRFRALLRNAFFLPVVMPLVAVGTLWKLLLTNQGLVNQVLGLIGITGRDWLLDPATALPGVAAASVWQGFGFETVVFLAALQSIPRDLYDAAHVDGAGAWQSFRAVTLPALRPTILFVFVVGLIGALQAYDQVVVMTSGGPMRATETVVFLLVDRFHALKLGSASAIAYLLVILLAVLSAIQLRLGREER